MIRSEVYVIIYTHKPITVQNMNTLRQVQYCVNVVSINNSGVARALNYKKNFV